MLDKRWSLWRTFALRVRSLYRRGLWVSWVSWRDEGRRSARSGVPCQAGRTCARVHESDGELSRFAIIGEAVAVRVHLDNERGLTFVVLKGMNQ